MELEFISRRPAGPSRRTPLLFVHGAWHGAWCWAVHFLDYVAAHGFEAHAVSLRGHGASEGRERLRWHRLADYAEDVAQAMARLQGNPVLVGHSMGGGVVQKVLEQHAVPAAVLLASLPPSGALRATLRVARRHPLRFLQANLALSLLPLVNTPQLARDAFFSTALEEALVESYAARLGDESYLGFLDMLALDLPRPGRVRSPVIVFGAAEDRIFSPREMDATALAYRTQAEMFDGMGHDMMLEPGWKTVADRMLARLGELP